VHAPRIGGCPPSTPTGSPSASLDQHGILNPLVEYDVVRTLPTLPSVTTPQLNVVSQPDRVTGPRTAPLLLRPQFVIMAVTSLSISW
jgi:DNA replication initiation complex subunit (GINS family)